MANSPSSIDLSHHLSDRAHELRPSPLKGLYENSIMPGVISLSGVPHPSLFPYQTMEGDVLLPTTYPVDPSASTSPGSLSWLWSWFASNKPATTHMTIPKYASSTDGPSSLQLSKALQYTNVAGLPQFLDFVRNFTLQVFKPAYSDFQIMANSGNTDGWTKASSILCQPGELILTEDWTYPAAIAAQWSMGVRPFPIPTDAGGMVPSELENILANWKEEEHGGKRRPHVMYTVPIGQNPTGAIMNAQRKQIIYDICVKYDIIIVEDDPYYFLQFPQYTRKSERSLRSLIPGTINAETSEKFVDSLAPSFVKFDYQGRVIRLDSFSKTIAPGCRLGWMTSNPLFASKMFNYTASVTNQPGGISQAMVIELVSKQWGPDGYIRWMRGISAQYTARRDFMLDCLFDSSHIGLVQSRDLLSSGAPVYDAYAKSTGSFSTCNKDSKLKDKPLFSISSPSSGMFLWVKMYLHHHRDWVPSGSISTLEHRLWTALAEGGVIVAPGYMFSADQDSTANTPAKYGHMRLSFSSVERELMKKAIDIFVKVTLEFFR